MRLSAPFLAVLLFALAVAPVAEAKPKKGGGKVSVTQNVGAAIPDGASAVNGPDGVLTSTIKVGNRFRGRVIRDVNVRLHSVGTPGTDYALDFFDLEFLLMAPNGATTLLFDWISGGSIGPLTLDDESTKIFGSRFPTSSFDLVSPHLGTSRPSNALAVMDNGPAKGAWTLIALDLLANPPATSTLVSWTLNVVAGKPYRSK